jgi:hypothetical protein
MSSKTKINKPNWLSLINIDSVYSFDRQRQAFSLFTMIAIALRAFRILCQPKLLNI